MDETTKKNASGCPGWCVQEHPADEHPEDRWHRSRVSSPPVVGWFQGAAEAAAAVVHVGLVQPRDGGELRVRLESDVVGVVDLDPCSAARLASATREALRLLEGAR
ncbi:hypothetical protein HQQ80_16365 [Microbacteriaceae bacterium VKM Ac-2855]|nr:hypothetical protein [Microbacteriaceae bacterium VKM Ac-2855]